MVKFKLRDWLVIAFVVAVLALLSCVGNCQTTAVTATVTDSDSVVWTNSQWSVSFVPNASNPNVSQYNIGGVSLTSPTYNHYLNQNGMTDGTGSFAVTLLDNNQISPSGSTWRFSIHSNTSAQATIYAPQVITGASESLTTFLSTNAVAPRFTAYQIGAFGYADLEVTPVPLCGGQYFNVNMFTTRVWSGTTAGVCNEWVNIGAGGSGGTCGHDFIPCLNTPNTWLLGLQLFKSNGVNNIPVADQGAGGGFETPDYVQGASSNSGPFFGCSVTINGVTAGNALFVIGTSETTGTVSDSKGDTYTSVGTVNGSTGDGGTALSIFIAPDAIGGNTTVTFGGLAEEVNTCVAIELNNVATTNPVDVFGGNFQVMSGLTSGSAGSITTTVTNDLILTGIQGVAGTLTLPGGYSAAYVNPSAGISFGSADQAVSSTGTFNPSFSWTTPINAYSGFVVGLKAKGSLLQTSDLHQWWTYTGAVLSGVNSNGQYYPPATAGCPTNTPEAGTNPIGYDTTAEELCYWNGAAWVHITSSTATQLQTNSVNNANQALVNFTNPTAFNGLNFAFSNPSGGIETFGVTGALTNAGLQNDSITINTVNCVLGGTCTITEGGSGLQQQLIINSGICTTANSAYGSCTFAVTWASAFPDTNYVVNCNPNVPTSGGTTSSVFVYNSTKTTTGITLALQNGDTTSADATTTAEIDCSAQEVGSGGGGGGSGPTLQTNGVNNGSQATLNFVNPASFNGLSFAFSNPTGGNETFTASGTLNNAGLTNTGVTVNGILCTLGGTCTVSSTAGFPITLGSTSIAANSTTTNIVGLTINSTTIPTSATLTQTICSGTINIPTALIASGALSSTVTATCTGLATTDIIAATSNVNVFGVTGFTPATTGILALNIWPTSNTINLNLENNTASGITPGALTINYRVTR